VWKYILINDQITSHLQQHQGSLHFAILCVYLFCIILKIKPIILLRSVSFMVYVMDVVCVLYEVEIEFLYHAI
jgi:hypothetical protein